MLETCNLPKRGPMKNAIMEYMRTVKTATSSEINEEIIRVFNISEADYSARTDDYTTTIFAYRMCWLRTELRKEGLIKSEKKGTWQLVE